MGFGDFLKDNTGVIVGTALAPGVGTLFGAQYDAGKKAAEKQGQLARMQEDFARQYGAEVKGLAAPSFAELSSVTNIINQRSETLGLQKAALQREYASLAQVDEITKRQGEQILSLMSGQDNARMTSTRKELDRRRKDLEGKLSQQLGPGWRSSSAGIEAMMRFEDMSTTALLNAESEAFSRYAGLSQVQGQKIQNVGALESLGVNADLNVIKAESALKERQIQAADKAYTAIAPTTGGQLLSQILKQRNISNLAGEAIGIGAMVAGSFAGGMGQGAGKSMFSGAVPSIAAPTGGEETMGRVFSVDTNNPRYDLGDYGLTKYSGF